MKSPGRYSPIQRRATPTTRKYFVVEAPGGCFSIVGNRGNGAPSQRTLRPAFPRTEVLQSGVSPASTRYFAGRNEVLRGVRKVSRVLSPTYSVERLRSWSRSPLWAPDCPRFILRTDPHVWCSRVFLGHARRLPREFEPAGGRFSGSPPPIRCVLSAGLQLVLLFMLRPSRASREPTGPGFVRRAPSASIGTHNHGVARGVASVGPRRAGVAANASRGSRFCLEKAPPLLYAGPSRLANPWPPNRRCHTTTGPLAP